MDHSHPITRAEPVENPAASLSLAFGLCSFLLSLALDTWQPRGILLGLLLIWLVGIPAILCANVALRKVGRLSGEVSGRRMAQAGLWLAFVAGCVVPTCFLVYGIAFPRTHVISAHARTISNCRQVIVALRIYAADHNGDYPDAALPGATSSNEVFRKLFQAEAIDNEMIFGSPVSPFAPDGNIGAHPDFSEAVKAGENHFAFTAGLTDSAGHEFPLAYENPSDASWPPKWDPDLAGTMAPGRTWPGGRVVVGFNDMSMIILPLVTPKGKGIELRPRPDGTDIFPAGHPELRILNVQK